jgi:methionyl-tRNA formyltransferase
MSRVVFMGTPDFAVPSLNALIASPEFEVVGAVTQPDRPAGRGNKLQPPPVKVAALEANIPIIQPEKLREAGAFEQLQAWQPDVIVVAAFGQILRQNVLDLPPHGCINVHASLLPRWRGAAPIQAAIRAGDSETGITIMRMEIGLDTGPMLRKRVIPILPTDTGQTLHDKLAALGGPLLIETLIPYLRSEITLKAQDDSLHTYAPMIKKDDGAINWNNTAIEIDRQVRAYTPWPGTFTHWNDQVLKVFAGKIVEGNAPTGKVIKLPDDSVAIGTGEGLFVPAQVQLAGKSPTETKAFSNGYTNFVGSTLI